MNLSIFYFITNLEKVTFWYMRFIISKDNHIEIYSTLEIKFERCL